VWLERRLDPIWRHDAVIIGARPQLGVNRLISAAARDGPLAWVVLEASDRGDQMAQGNKLSDGLAVALGSRLFPRATPYWAGLSLLERYLEALPPITLAVSGICNGMDLAAGLVALRAPGFRVLLSDEAITEAALKKLDVAGSPGVLILDEAALRLSFVEAKVLVAGRIADAELRLHLDEAEHAYESLLFRLGKVLGDEFQPAVSGSESVAQELEIDVLLEAGQWREAAEMAVDEAPERAADVVREVAPMFHERGLHQALWQLLGRLRSGAAADERILFWRLATAVRLDRVGEVRAAVEHCLERRDAPDLRALHAGVYLEAGEARREVDRAYRASETPFTTYQHGRGLPDAREGARMLKKAVRLAEREGRAHEVSRNASALTARLIDSGEYSEAASWGEWALSHFDRRELSDTQQRLYILNNWAYARLLTGESVGLEDLLREAEEGFADAFPGLRALFRSTLGDCLLAMERPEEALEYYLINYEEASRNMKGIRALGVVRALAEEGTGKGEAACAVAKEAFALTGIDGWDYHRPAVLALGMALAFLDPVAAEKHLERVLQTEPATLPAPQRAQATLYLAYATLARGEKSRARSIIENCYANLTSLSPTGLRLISGPAGEFRELWRWCRGEAVTLELRFLGRREVLVKGEPVSLGVQPCNVLALLAYHTDGLAPMRLLSYLKLESENTTALYAALSKLRKLTPISAAPYRLEVDFTADFIDAIKLLRDGEARRALELYRGPLLEDSDAPGVVELRQVIDETFRQAILDSSDAEATFTLAQRSVDDLELWEHALELLNRNDTRALLARARVSLLRREY
jgi:hypothetical protein